MIGFLEVHKAVYDRLKNNLTYSVFDVPPQDTASPFVQVGDLIARDWGTKTHAGFEIRVEIHAWSPYQGKKEAEGMIGEICSALQDELEIPGYRIGAQFLESAEIKAEKGMRHGKLTYIFRILKEG